MTELISPTIEDMGYTFFGDDWLPAFAEELGVTEDEVRSWESEPSTRPSDLQEKIEKLGRLQIELIEAMLAQMNEAGLRSEDRA